MSTGAPPFPFLTLHTANQMELQGIGRNSTVFDFCQSDYLTTILYENMFCCPNHTLLFKFDQIKVTNERQKVIIRASKYQNHP